MSDRLEQFLSEYMYFSEEEAGRIRSVWNYVSQLKKNVARACGEDFMDHPLRVARILADLSLDGDSIACALLHGSTDSLNLTAAIVEEKFGKNIARLAEGTSRISAMKLQNKTLHQAEIIRKMFFAMIGDIRVMLIRLADRLDKMRNLKNFPEDQQKIIALETIDIWAPLANRLGTRSIKEEMEDLCLKYLYPDAYTQIKSFVAAKKDEREIFLGKAEKAIYSAAYKANIDITISSRAKHFWSIYQKMKKRNKSIDEIFDSLAIRILCPSVNDCYTMLGLVHTIWKPLEGRFKDYIAMPKTNGYQSLHTTVMCYEGNPLEIQIRTREMHQIAENGIASHWLYKKAPNNTIKVDEHLSIISKFKELSEKNFNDDEFLAEIKSDILGESIYVFTPKGDIKEMPAGSTAIDFAYSIHSAIGEKIVAAKADGSIIPLSQPLKNTQVVEIITHPNARPTRNQYAIVKTAKARQKIRAWLQENDPDSEFEKKESAPPVQTGKQQTKEIQETPEPGKELPVTDTAVLKIRIGDTTNFMIKFAKCCNPLPPKPITGYVSRGRGIIIHSTDCRNLENIPDIAHRHISVEWEIPPAEVKQHKRKT
ncbi:RelA/SpoT family protein [Brucepastera parasyntrophica]|uniref:RelA/SpoT family protein n=1 Tax=Brucepastera parasyntrophica TaxID=2880008 RepID=UPI00210C2447|nr:RelA/SpoT family protein [Brucepastera parasyntrophica]ULQ59344.1 RelA/SpoT family protein [Brucepastera parasyntrophica]